MKPFLQPPLLSQRDTQLGFLNERCTVLLCTVIAALSVRVRMSRLSSVMQPSDRPVLDLDLGSTSSLGQQLASKQRHFLLILYKTSTQPSTKKILNIDIEILPSSDSPSNRWTLNVSPSSHSTHVLPSTSMPMINYGNTLHIAMSISLSVWNPRRSIINNHVSATSRKRSVRM